MYILENDLGLNFFFFFAEAFYRHVCNKFLIWVVFTIKISFIIHPKVGITWS